MRDYNYRIYKNLNKGGFSIQKYFKGRGWRVIVVTDNFEAEGVSTLIYEAGRQNVIRDKCKKVHAFLCAKSVKYRLEIPNAVDLENFPRISYNPYSDSKFKVSKKGLADGFGGWFFGAERVLFYQDDVFDVSLG